MKKELLDSLNNIKEECSRHKDCATCPLIRKSGYCFIYQYDDSTPCEWNTEKLAEE